MKFAKELEKEAIPEWKDKYLNYKKGKKLIKAISGALRSANRTPRSGNIEAANATPTTAAAAATEAIPVPTSTHTRYGSIVGSAPDAPSRLTRATSLNLPDPALDVDEQAPSLRNSTDRLTSRPSTADVNSSSSPPGENAYKVGKTRHPFGRHSSLPSKASGVQRISSNKGEKTLADRSRLIRGIFAKHRVTPLNTPISDIPLEARQEIYAKQAEFENFLNSELEKIESFYREREEEAKTRLETLKDQLHMLRDQRKDDLASYRAARANGHHDHKSLPRKHDRLSTALHPVEAVKRVRHEHTLSKPENQKHSPPEPFISRFADYARRRKSHVPSYSDAKRQLKVATQEYYRGLDLLRHYAVMNRTAFRKVNKKYDKAIDAQPRMQYMNTKVNNAYFVKSDVLDELLTTVEDLFARYFEKGSRKAAINKLKNRNPHQGDYSASSFRNGVFFAAGAIFGILGVVYAVQILFGSQYSESTVLYTSYSLQLHGGYFIMLFLALFFCIDCWIMDRNKINYPFIFELDGRHKLDWRQLCELPCLFFAIQGFIVWLQFSDLTGFGDDPMYIYWPLVLVGVTFLILFFPAQILYHKTRKWFLYTCWRLLFSGIYPVEFRDLLIGDIFCSLTYSVGNVEVFFCLYAHNWDNPGQCNSGTSRLLGFLSTLPGIWRALQCMRRYYDTREAWPHLVNCGKYGATILQYMFLSIWRIHRAKENKAAYFALALINGLYTSTWDLLLDWSLLKPHAKHWLLRDKIGYRSKAAYYVAIVIDPIIRFNWIFYIIFGYEQFQHSAILSFAVALSEAFRRGVWILFRVENNHVTNVEKLKASSDKPLPYPTPERTTPEGTPIAATGDSPALSSLRRRRTAEEEETGQESSAKSIRARVGTLLDSAHAEDFERRKNVQEYDRSNNDDDDDDDDDDEEEDEEGDESADTDTDSMPGQSSRI